MVHTHSVLVHVDANDVDLSAPQIAQGAGKTERFDDRGVALLQQDFVDEFDPLAGAGRDQDIVNRGIDATVLSQLFDQELAQRKDALRATRKVVHGNVPWIAAEHPGGRLDKSLGGYHVRVAMTADEVVPGVTAPRRRRGRQVPVE